VDHYGICEVDGLDLDFATGRSKADAVFEDRRSAQARLHFDPTIDDRGGEIEIGPRRFAVSFGPAGHGCGSCGAFGSYGNFSAH
jgi:hypothetical protein